MVELVLSTMPDPEPTAGFEPQWNEEDLTVTFGPGALGIKLWPRPVKRRRPGPHFAACVKEHQPLPVLGVADMPVRGPAERDGVRAGAAIVAVRSNDDVRRGKSGSVEGLRYADVLQRLLDAPRPAII